MVVGRVDAPHSPLMEDVVVLGSAGCVFFFAGSDIAGCHSYRWVSLLRVTSVDVVARGSAVGLMAFLTLVAAIGWMYSAKTSIGGYDSVVAECERGKTLTSMN